MSTHDEMVRSARQLSQIADQVFVHNREIQQIGEEVSRQLLFTPSIVKLHEEMAQATARMFEPMQRMAAQAVRPSLEPLLAKSAKVAAGFQASMPKLVVDFPKIADLVAMNLPAIQDFRPMLEHLEAIRIPPEKLAPEFLDSLRLEAKRSLEQVEGPEGEALAETMQSLEAIDDATNATAKADPRRNVFLVLVVLGVLFGFLANQRQILETAFEDMALLGTALTHVWEYATALLLLLLAYDASRRD
jgi:hypothetical protein